MLLTCMYLRIRDTDQFSNTFHSDLLQSELNQLLKPKMLCIHFAVVFLHCVCTSRQDITLPMCARMLNIDQKLCCFHITFLDKTCFW